MVRMTISSMWRIDRAERFFLPRRPDPLFEHAASQPDKAPSRGPARSRASALLGDPINDLPSSLLAHTRQRGQRLEADPYRISIPAQTDSFPPASVLFSKARYLSAQPDQNTGRCERPTHSPCST